MSTSARAISARPHLSLNPYGKIPAIISDVSLHGLYVVYAPDDTVTAIKRLLPSLKLWIQPAGSCLHRGQSRALGHRASARDRRAGSCIRCLEDRSHVIADPPGC